MGLKAKERDLAGIFIDNTINPASMNDEQLAQEIAAVKLANTHGIVFTMNNINPRIRSEIAALVKKILGRDIKNMNAAEIFAIALEAVKKAENREDIDRLKSLIAAQRERVFATPAILRRSRRLMKSKARTNWSWLSSSGLSFSSSSSCVRRSWRWMPREPKPPLYW